MEQLMTDPDRLAKYTIGFFTHVVPINNQQQQQPQFSRPEFPAMPMAQGGGQQQFSLAQVRPEERWRVADQMERQGLFRGKQLVVQA